MVWRSSRFLAKSFLYSPFLGPCSTAAELYAPRPLTSAAHSLEITRKATAHLLLYALSISPGRTSRCSPSALPRFPPSSASFEDRHSWRVALLLQSASQLLRRRQMGRHGKDSKYVVDLTKDRATVLREWKLGPWERVAYGGTAAILFTLSLASSIALLEQWAHASPLSVGIPCCTFIGGMFFLCFTVRATIALTTDAILVRNLAGWRRIPLEHVTSVRPGYYGTAISYTPGKVWFALASQKSNLSSWLNHQTRADEIAEVLRSESVRATEPPR